MDVKNQKQILRDISSAKRQAISQENRDALEQSICNNIETIIDKDITVIAAYHPIKDEANLISILNRLRKDGYKIALPVITSDGESLVFKEFVDEDDLILGQYDVKAPKDSSKTLIPDLYLIPMLGFNKEKSRLGYGGGFYDKALCGENGNVKKYGIAFSNQELEFLPSEKHDIKMDYIITENGCF